MSDWESELTPEQREQWEAYVDHFRRETLQKMAESGFVMQLVPDREHFDVKFATELGCSIMLDKPILAVVMPGAEISGKLRLVADEIIVADIDTEAGRKLVGEQIKRFMADLA
jgi:hypothetical protein